MNLEQKNALWVILRGKSRKRRSAKNSRHHRDRARGLSAAYRGRIREFLLLQKKRSRDLYSRINSAEISSAIG